MDIEEEKRNTERGQEKSNKYKHAGMGEMQRT